MAKDYYAVLGASSNWTTQQIRDRFRQLAREKHPDRFQGEAKIQAELEFQEITEAFNVLADPNRRRQLDFDLKRPEAEPEPTHGAAVRVYMQRGSRAYKEGKYLDAADNFRRATTEDPKSDKAWYSLALAYSHQNRWLQQATQAASRAVKLSPMEPKYLALAGRLYARSGQADLAEKHLQEALNWGGDDPQVRAALDEVKKRTRGGLFGRIVG